jgi:hypothetical protein
MLYRDCDMRFSLNFCFILKARSLLSNPDPDVSDPDAGCLKFSNLTFENKICKNLMCRLPNLYAIYSICIRIRKFSKFGQKSSISATQVLWRKTTFTIRLSSHQCKTSFPIQGFNCAVMYNRQRPHLYYGRQNYKYHLTLPPAVFRFCLLVYNSP